MQTTVSAEDAATPLHKFVRRHFSVLVPSRSQTHVAFKAGQILVNGAPAAEGLRLRAGDVVSIARTAAHVAHARSNNVGVRAVHCDARVVVVWKSAGVSMDPRSAIFSDAVRDRANLAPGSELYPLLELDKAVSGLVVLSTHNPSSIPSTVNSLESTYRCIVHGRVGSAEGLIEGSEYAVEFPIRGTLCSTLFRIVSFTSTRNSPDGWLTTLDATPVGGFVHKQVMTHLYSSDHPVIGNSRMTKQHRTCRDKGIFCSLIKLSFNHPDTGETLSFIESEPSKFEALRLKEAKFSERKLAEIEEATQSLTTKRFKSNEFPETEAAGTNNADDDEDDDTPGQSGFKNAAYIRGSQEFRGLLFKVSPAVMIPRASSGILVESAVFALLEKYSGLQKAITILDMGTGSGSLLISTVVHLEASLLKNGMTQTDLSGIALDASSEALAVTRENLDAHGLSSRVKIHFGTFGSVSNVFSNATASKPVQIILCNPPYLSPRIKKVTSIDASLLNEEPAVALFSGDTGLEAYQEIMGGIRLADGQFGYKGFSKHCVLVLEIGHGCSERVKKIFVDGICSVELEQESGRRWEFVELKRDHRKLERCLIFRKL
ncbi:S-adenosyl-L-methionine-dependent methyltransferase [Chytriomyces cf. hyalinus JEL632]|nr:S-adenosyl-L-methionine-dependent methyltransferase [Chytriomyces cf. hyalinus JEL632]